jgi:type VI secretion system protein
MSLILKVLSYRGDPPAEALTCVFDTHGGSVGRWPDNRFVLPDPERYLSRRHGVITFGNNDYQYTDTSTGGTYVVNRDRLLLHETVALAEGDVLRIGEYDLGVTLVPEDQASGFDEFGTMAAPPSPSWSEPPAWSAADPFAAPPPGNPPYGAGSGDSPFHESFIPPEPQPVPSAMAGLTGLNVKDLLRQLEPNAVPAAEPPLAGEHWDELLKSLAPGEPSAPAGFPASARQEITERSYPPSTGAPTNERAKRGIGPPGLRPAGPPGPPAAPSLGRPAEPRTPEAGPAPPRMPHPPSRIVPSPLAPGRGRPAAQPQPQPQPTFVGSAPKPAATGSPREPLPSGATDSALFRCFLEGVGLDPRDWMGREDAAAIMNIVGLLMRDFVEGMLMVMRARAEMKSQLRVSTTTMRSHDNNPLKFTVTAEDALKIMLGRRHPGFMEPVEAVRNAYADLMNHQMAMTAGVQGALAEALRRFNPERFDKLCGDGMVLNRKAKCWDAYCKAYPGLAADVVEGFFGDEFVEVYERQMRALYPAKPKK